MNELQGRVIRVQKMETRRSRQKDHPSCRACPFSFSDISESNHRLWTVHADQSDRLESLATICEPPSPRRTRVSSGRVLYNCTPTFLIFEHSRILIGSPCFQDKCPMAYPARRVLRWVIPLRPPIRLTLTSFSAALGGFGLDGSRCFPGYRLEILQHRFLRSVPRSHFSSIPQALNTAILAWFYGGIFVFLTLPVSIYEV